MKQNTLPDPRLLQIFVAVAEAGGLSAAEQRLNLSRSSISTNLTELETRLGLSLCRRGRTGFALTDAGRAVYQAAIQWQQAGNQLNQQLQALQHQQLVGELSIAFCDDSLNHPQFRFAEVIARFRQQAPLVRLVVKSLNPRTIGQALEQGEVQLGLAPVTEQTRRFYHKPLYREQSHLYCASQQRLFVGEVSADKLKGLPLVAGGYSWQGLREQEQHFEAAALAPELEARTALILSGSYLGFLPEQAAQPWQAQGLLRQLLPERFHYSTQMAVHCLPTQRDNPLVRQLFVQLNDSHYVHAQKDQ